MITEHGQQDPQPPLCGKQPLLIDKMRAIGFATYIDGSNQGPIITAFFYPSRVSFRFDEFYHYIKERGCAIYPGKLIEMDTFRIGNIGEIYPEDIDKLTAYHCRPVEAGPRT